MNRALAGLAGRGAAGAGAEDLVRGALAGEPAVRTLRAPGLALAWSGGGEPAPAGPWRALLDGELYDPDPQGAAPEAVLVAAWARAGAAGLAPLRGDFAAVIWRADAETVVLVRDQLGGHSICLAEDARGLAFGSEAVHVLALLPRRPGVDPVALAHHLAVRGHPEGRTLHAGVRRLPAAHLAAHGPAGLRLTRYWRVAAAETTRGMSAEEAGARVGAALTVAVRRRSRPGERTAVLLSGGLDSSSVAAVAVRRLEEDRRPMGTYSAVFPEHPGMDEGARITAVAEALGLPSVRMAVRGGSSLAGALEYLRAWALPPMSPNLFFWTPLLERAAADGVTAVLDGEGGDELFAHSPWLVADRLRRGRLLSALRLAASVPGAYAVDPENRARWLGRWLRSVGARGLAPHALHALHRRRQGAGAYAPGWFGPELREALLDTDDPWRWKLRPGPRWWAAFAAQQTESSSLFAYEHVDRRGALAGLAVRHPLLDVDVLETLARLPPEHAFDGPLSRPLLRRATAGILPDAQRLRRDKSALDGLFYAAMRGADLPVIRALLTDPEARLRPWVDLDRIRVELLDHPPERAGADTIAWFLHLWRMVTAEMFLRSTENQAWEQGIPGFETLERSMVDFPAER